MDKKVGKKEILLLLIIFAAAVIGYFVFQKLQSTPGAQVKVTVDGTVYGTYDLYTTGEKAKKIQIKNAEGTVTNTLVIENGKADMISADCPDKLCVNQHAISSNGETIVCLPNKVVVEVEDGERLSRALVRERQQATPRYTELCRRFLADTEDFSEEHLKEAGIEMRFENDALDACISRIKLFIQKYL